MSNTDIVTKIVRESTDQMEAEGFDAIVGLLDKKDAEIGTLTERNAFLLTSAETAQAKLAECRAEVEKLTPIDGIYQAWVALVAGPMTKDDTVAFIEKAHTIAEAAQAAHLAAKGQV